MSFFYLVIGLIFLVKGADLLVDSASKLAKMYGVPAFIIGLSVVAFGTSAPEAAIGVLSGIKQANQITLGDVVGSSIVNIVLVIGLTSVILPLKVERSVTRKEIPISFIIQVVLVFMAYVGGVISRIDGIVLLIGFILFIFYIGKQSQNTVDIDNNNDDGNSYEQRPSDDLNISKSLVQDGPVGKDKSKLYILKLLGLLMLGLAGLIAGGNIVVDSSVEIAHMFGLSETLIGLTVVAIGTSLPELVTCVLAAAKKEVEIAVGNVIGSNIFNVLFVMGLSTLIYPIGVTRDVFIDFAVMLAATLLLFVLTLLKASVSRIGGIILLLYYGLYLTMKIFLL